MGFNKHLLILSFILYRNLFLNSEQVIEIVSGDCVIVADDSLPLGDPSAERRVNLSSIRAPKMGNRRAADSKAEPWAYDAKEFLRTRLIGRQVCFLILGTSCCYLWCSVLLC